MCCSPAESVDASLPPWSKEEGNQADHPMHPARETPQLYQQGFRRSADLGRSSRTRHTSHQGLNKAASLLWEHLCAEQPPGPGKSPEILTKISCQLEIPTRCIRTTGNGYREWILHTDCLHHRHVWQGLEVGRAGLAVMLMKQDLPPSSNGSLMLFFFNDHNSYYSSP